MGIHKTIFLPPFDKEETANYLYAQGANLIHEHNGDIDAIPNFKEVAQQTARNLIQSYDDDRTDLSYPEWINGKIIELNLNGRGIEYVFVGE